MPLYLATKRSDGLACRLNHWQNCLPLPVFKQAVRSTATESWAEYPYITTKLYAFVMPKQFVTPFVKRMT